MMGTKQPISFHWSLLTHRGRKFFCEEGHSFLGGWQMSCDSSFGQVLPLPWLICSTYYGFICVSNVLLKVKYPPASCSQVSHVIVGNVQSPQSYTPLKHVECVGHMGWFPGLFCVIRWLPQGEFSAFKDSKNLQGEMSIKFMYFENHIQLKVLACLHY